MANMLSTVSMVSALLTFISFVLIQVRHTPLKCCAHPALAPGTAPPPLPPSFAPWMGQMSPGSTSPLTVLVYRTCLDSFQTFSEYLAVAPTVLPVFAGSILVSLFFTMAATLLSTAYLMMMVVVPKGRLRSVAAGDAACAGGVHSTFSYASHSSHRLLPWHLHGQGRG